MDLKSLKIINISTALVIIIIIVFGIFVLPSYFSIVSCIAGILFWLVLYLNLRKSILEFIDNIRNPKIRIDPERVERLKQIKRYITITALFISALILAFAWVYMQAQFIWAVFFVSGVMLIAAYHNLFLTVTYLIAKQPFVNFSKVPILLIFIALPIAFIWFFMQAQLFYMIIIFILFILMLKVLFNARAAVYILKRINDKPVDRKKEMWMAIINNSIIMIIVIILLMRMFRQFYVIYILLISLIGPLILLMILANTWKLISDISYRPETGASDSYDH